MKIYSFYGLRRSGNHAILEWILYNLGNGSDRLLYERGAVVVRGNAAYINEANAYIAQNPPNHLKLLRDIIILNNMDIETIIVAYEDVYPEYSLVPSSKKIFLTRDIENLVASRLKKNQRNMLVDSEFFKKWIDYTKQENKILFDDWISSKEYRDSISKELFNVENLDKTEYVAVNGGGSSFSGLIKPTVEELKSRSKMVNLPQEAINRINQPDITEIRKRLGFIEPTKITVLGDSHSLVFNHYSGNDYQFNVNVVHGATARGAINPNTKTNSLAIYKDALEKTSTDKIAIMLGEVDCGYLIWYKNKFEGLSVESQLKESLSKLSAFVKLHVKKYYQSEDIILIASPPPTIEDNTDKKFLAGARASVDTPLQERMELTLEYNRRLKEIADIDGYKYIDIMDKVTEGFKVKDEYRSDNPHDHHLNSKATIDLWVDELNKNK